MTALFEHPIADMAAMMFLRPPYHHGQNIDNSATDMPVKATAHFSVLQTDSAVAAGFNG